ncbi:MAG: hypothetical protein KDE68_11205 [Rhodocyclaceae bacterium]|nr:hypothetical protein [Rhodocyclaceae bacterium]
MKKYLLTGLCALSLPAFGQDALTVDWTWMVRHKCSVDSPALTVSGIPAGTAQLKVRMSDLDRMHIDHGGGEVAHDGAATATLAEGTLENYKGPCPPNFYSFGHDYQFTVEAIAADGGTVLARGNRTQTFSARTAKKD